MQYNKMKYNNVNGFPLPNLIRNFLVESMFRKAAVVIIPYHYKQF